MDEHKRYRLLCKQERLQNSHSASDGMFKPVGGVQFANSHEEALRDYRPAPGRWLVLCESDATFNEFRVSHRTEIDLEPHATLTAVLSS